MKNIHLYKISRKSLSLSPQLSHPSCQANRLVQVTQGDQAPLPLPDNTHIILISGDDGRRSQMIIMIMKGDHIVMITGDSRLLHMITGDNRWTHMITEDDH